jgi:hypothetical protein
MANSTKRVDMFNSEEGTAIRLRLEEMIQDGNYITAPSSYTADVAAYPDHQIPFIDKHLHYLNTHQAVNAEHYMSNLRLLLRKR